MCVYIYFSEKWLYIGTTFPISFPVSFLPPSCLKRELKTRVEQLQCAWAHIISIFWCPAVSFATHSALSAWNTPCCLQKENLTLSIKTSTTQRWNTILLTSPSSFFSLPLSLSTPVFLSRCAELFIQKLSSFSSASLFYPAIAGGGERPPASIRSLFLFCSQAPNT